MPALSLTELVDDRRLTAFDLNVLFWTFLALFTDGYDITVVAFAAPEMARQWNLDASSLGPVLSASMVGVFFGAPLFGAIGDRWGRRVAIATGCILFGITTLALVGSRDVWQMTCWRFVGGMGIGGVMPNATALMAELAPARHRAALIIIMFTGAFVGSAAPSFVVGNVASEHLIPTLFLLGGVVPVAVAVGAILFLPESVKFLATTQFNRNRLLKTLRRMRPGVVLSDDAAFIDASAAVEPAQRIGRALFKPGLRWVTLLLWASFICSLATTYYLSTWLPLMFEHHGLSPYDSARVTALYHLAGGVGSLVICAFVDRFGFLLISVLFLSSAPAIALMGAPGRSVGFVTAATVMAGFLGQSVQLALNAGAGLLYPTVVRAKAVGWAFAVGRIGSVAGPMLGGLVVGMKLQFEALFLIPAISMVLGGGAAVALTVVLFRQTGSLRMGATSAVPSNLPTDSYRVAAP